MMFKAPFFGSSSSDASYFGSSSSDWGRRSPPQDSQQQPPMTATSEPVTNPSSNVPSQAQTSSPVWKGQVRRFPPVYTQDAYDVYHPAENRPSDARFETMEDRHYQAPPMPAQYYSGHHHCRWQHHQNKYKLDQANKVADLIGNRFAHSPSDSKTTTYSLLLGAGTFLALTGLASATGMRPRLGNLLGHSRMAHLTLTAAAGVAAGTVSLRYQAQHQTLNDLKIVGTYMTPSEPSPSADALSQHPLVVQALMERQREQQMEQRHREQQLQRAGYHHGHRYGPHRSWEDHRNDFPFSFSSSHRGGGTKRQILTELDHVLDHLEERRRALLLQNSKQSGSEPGPATTVQASSGTRVKHE